MKLQMDKLEEALKSLVLRSSRGPNDLEGFDPPPMATADAALLLDDALAELKRLRSIMSRFAEATESLKALKGKNE